MQTTPLEFPCTDKNGIPITIKIEQFDADGCNMTVTQGGASPSVNLYQLTNIRRVGEGVLTGNVSGGILGVFAHPTVRVTILPNTFNVSVGGMWWNPPPQSFLDTADVSKRANDWVDGANFPPA